MTRMVKAVNRARVKALNDAREHVRGWDDGTYTSTAMSATEVMDLFVNAEAERLGVDVNDV